MKYVKIFITLFFVMSTACVQGMVRSPVSSLPLQGVRPTGSSAPKSFTAEQLTAGVTVKRVMKSVMSSTMLSTHDHEVTSPEMANMKNIWLNLETSFHRVDQSFLQGKELALGVVKDVVGDIGKQEMRRHKSLPFMPYLQFSNMLGGSSVAGNFLRFVTKWKVIPHNFDRMISSLPARTQLSTIADYVAESQAVIDAAQYSAPAAIKAQFLANDVIQGTAGKLSSAQRENGIVQVLAQAVGGQAQMLLPELYTKPYTTVISQPDTALESTRAGSMSPSSGLEVVSSGQVELLAPVNALSVVEGLVVPPIIHDISVPEEQKIFITMSYGVLNPAYEQACVDAIVRLPGMTDYKDAVAARMSMMRNDTESVTQAVAAAIKGSVIEDVSMPIQQLDIEKVVSAYQQTLRSNQPEKLLLTDRVNPVMPTDVKERTVDEKFLLGAIQTVKYEQAKYEYVQNTIFRNKTRLFFTQFFYQPFGQILLMMALFKMFESQDDEQSAETKALVKKDQPPFYDLFLQVMMNVYYAGIDIPLVPASYYDFKSCLFDALSLLGITMYNQEVRAKASQAFQDLDQIDVRPEVVQQSLKEAQLIEKYTQGYTLMLQDVPLEKVLALDTTQPLLPQIGKLSLVPSSSSSKSLPKQSQAVSQKAFAAVANWVKSLQALYKLSENVKIFGSPQYVELMQAKNDAQLAVRMKAITAQQTTAIQNTIKMYQMAQSPVAKSGIFNQLAYMCSLFGAMQYQALQKHATALLHNQPKQDVATSTTVEGSRAKKVDGATSTENRSKKDVTTSTSVESSSAKTADIATSTEDLENLGRELHKQSEKIMGAVAELPLSDEQKKILNTIQEIQQQEVSERFKLLESEGKERKQYIQDAARDLVARQAAQKKVETSTEPHATTARMRDLFGYLKTYQNKLQQLLGEHNIKHIYDYDKLSDLWKKLPEEIQAFSDELSVRTIMGYLEGLLLLADKDKVSATLQTQSEKTTYTLLQLLQNVQQIKKQRVYKLLQLLKAVSPSLSKDVIKA